MLNGYWVFLPGVQHLGPEVDHSTLSSAEVKHGKSEAIPLQTWAGPEGSRRLRLPDFKTVST